MTEPTEEQKSKFDQLVEQIEATLGEATQTKTVAAQAAAEAKTAKTESTTSLQSTKQVLDQVNALLAQAKTNQQELQALLEQSKTNSAKTAEIARTADEKDTRVEEYEAQLAKLQEEYETTREKIDDLLPGATSTGLAKAFRIRKEALAPTLAWSKGIFILSILGFFGIGIWAIFWENIETLPQFIVFSLERSPILAALVLLEEFARRLYGRTLKLEEDYAYKETLSFAFDGYQEAMSSVEANAKQTLAHTLSMNVLAALKERPGRLLDQETDEDELSIKALLSQAQPETGEASAGLISKIYDDVKAQLKGSALKAIAIILLVLAIGVAIGRHSSSIAKIFDQDLPTTKSTLSSKGAPSDER